MAHDLTYLVDSDAPDGLWEDAPAATGFPFGAPTPSGATLAWVPTGHCRGCAQAQTENHETRSKWRLHDGSGKVYRGANPFPAAQSPKGLARQIIGLQQALVEQERNSDGYWSVVDENTGGMLVNTLYNAANAAWTIRPNFYDGVWFTITGVSGANLTLTPNGDIRSMYHNERPMQAGDVVLFRGNNLANYFQASVVDIVGLPEGLTPTVPSPLVVKINKDIAEWITTAHTGASWDAECWIGCRYWFPDDFVELEYPSVGWYSRRVVKYNTSSPEWASRTFRLKDASGNDCAIAPPQNALGLGYIFSARKNVGGTWLALDCSGYRSNAPRTALYVATSSNGGRTVFNDSSITIEAAFRQDVTGLALGDFSVSSGATLSGLTTISARRYSLTLTVTDTGVSPQTFVVSLPAGAAEETGGVPTQAGELTVTFDEGQPEPTLTDLTDDDGKERAIAIRHDDEHSGAAEAALGLEEGDFSETDCVLTGLTGNGAAYGATALLLAASSSLSLGTGKTTDDGGNQNAASNTLALTYAAPEQGGFPVPDPVVYAAEASESGTGAWSCTVKFLNSGVTGFAAADIDVINGTVSNFAAVDSQTYTFDLAADDAGEVVVSIAAGAATDEYFDQETEKGDFAVLYPGETWPGIIESAASNELSLAYYDAGPEVDLEARDYSEANGGGVRVHFLCRFERPVVGDFATAGAVNAAAGVIGPVNVRGTDQTFEFDMIALAAGDYYCEISDGVLDDRAGLGNQASARVTWTVAAEATPGSGAATDKRLFITHSLGAFSGRNPQTNLYLGETVNGVSGFEDLLSGASELEVAYYWQTTQDDYANKPVPVSASRCKWCKPDWGKIWGYSGPDSLGLRWHCRKSNDKPTGLGNFNGECILFGSCSHFELLSLEDLLTGPNLQTALRQIWTGQPGGLSQRTAGSSSYREWFWRAMGHPSIQSHLTPVEQLAYSNCRTPRLVPRGSGQYGFWESGGFHQGVAHRWDGWTWTDPNSGAPGDGTLAQIADWKTKNEAIANQDVGGAARRDPYGEMARWPGWNSWGSARQTGEALDLDEGPFRYRRQNGGHDTADYCLIPRIANQSGVQDREHGTAEWGAWDADLGRLAAGDPAREYGLVLRAKPHPNTTDTNRVAASGTIAAIAAATAAEGVNEFRILCAPGSGGGIYYDALTKTYVSVGYYRGGNVVGLPEWARHRNPQQANAMPTGTLMDNSLGPGKGARRGMHVVFGSSGGLGDLTHEFPYGIADGVSVGPMFPILEARACKGENSERVDWETGGVYANDDYWNDEISNCVDRANNEVDWLNRPDVLHVADVDGILADLVSGGDVAAGSSFVIWNGDAPFSPLQDDISSVQWTIYGTAAWTTLSASDYVVVDKIMGIVAVKKAAADAIAAAAGASEVCFRIVNPDGRVSYSANISARDINEATQGVAAVDMCWSKLYFGQLEAFSHYAQQTAGNWFPFPYEEHPYTSEGFTDIAAFMAANRINNPTAHLEYPDEEVATTEADVSAVSHTDNYCQVFPGAPQPITLPCHGHHYRDIGLRLLKVSTSVPGLRLAFHGASGDGLTIAAAYTVLRVQIGSITRWKQCYHWLYMPVWNFPWGDPTKIVPSCVFDSDVASWQEDYELDPSSPQVKVAFFGKSKDGTVHRLGTTGSITAYYPGDPPVDNYVECTGLVRAMYRTRPTAAYTAFGYAVVDDSFPDSDALDTMPEPVIENIAQHSDYAWEGDIKYPSWMLTAPSVSWAAGGIWVQWALSEDAVLPGLGPNNVNLPRMR